MKPAHPQKIRLPILQPGFSAELQYGWFLGIYCYQYIKRLLFLGYCLSLCPQIKLIGKCIIFAFVKWRQTLIVFSLFSEFPHIIQKENDLWDCMHYGKIAIMDFDQELMILPFISFFPLIYLPLCCCAKLPLDRADNAAEHSNQNWAANRQRTM